MDRSIKDKLLSCRSYDDAKPILETQGAGLAVHKLFTTGYGVQAKQPLVARDFFNTAIQEMEDDDDDKNKMKIVKEVDGGKSEQSSSTTGLEKVGSESDAAESFHAQADKKDQMGVAINEAFPPQGGMPPQQGQFPPQQQMGAGGCGGQPQQGQVPPMNPQQQMQYTISEVVRSQLAPMQEAIKALDKKIQETQKTQPSSLELGSKMGGPKSIAMIRETTGNKDTDLAKTRRDITKLNNYLNSQ